MDASAHIIVSGVVQGVGYRFFVLRQARRLQLTGWVRNLSTGEVEIEVEGPKGLVESLINLLPTGNTWATVRNVDVNWQPYKNKFDGFDITY